jgi:hypothetical protein
MNVGNLRNCALLCSPPLCLRWIGIGPSGWREGLAKFVFYLYTSMWLHALSILKCWYIIYWNVGTLRNNEQLRNSHVTHLVPYIPMTMPILKITWLYCTLNLWIRANVYLKIVIKRIYKIEPIAWLTILIPLRSINTYLLIEMKYKFIKV